MAALGKRAHHKDEAEKAKEKRGNLKQPLEKIKADTDRDHWMSAEEAVEYGLVNKIVSHHREL